MINRLDPRLTGYDNLHATAPRQAEPTQGGSVFRQALSQELKTSPATRPEASAAVPEQRPVLPPPSQRVNNVNAMAAERAKMMRQLEPMIHEVRQIAEDAGFIDVSSENVLRAYQTGQSFLADYRV